MYYIGVLIGDNGHARLNRSFAAAMWPFCQITLTTCLNLFHIHQFLVATNESITLMTVTMTVMSLNRNFLYLELPSVL